MSAEPVVCPRCQGMLVCEEEVGLRHIKCVMCGFLKYKPLICQCKHDEVNRIYTKQKYWT